MSDSRDLNRDGKVSFVEKVKDKLHLGHKDADHTTHSQTTTHNSLDKNGDGHISTSEKLMAGKTTGALPIAGVVPVVGAMPVTTAGGFASQDLNRDGYISTSEKLASGHMASGSVASGHMMSGHMSEEARLKLHEEQLAISKREVGAGEVDIHKRVHEQHVEQTIPIRREEVVVERRPLSGIADANAHIAPQDETMRVALFREELVTEKRVVPTEEVIVRKQEVVDQQTVGATLRSEHVEAIQTGIHGSNLSAHDARDRNMDGHVSMGEKLMGVSGSNMHSGFDARDRNMDGHVSMGEKLTGASGSNMHSGAFDARDKNLDGHVSMGEKFQGAATGAAPLKAARG